MGNILLEVPLGLFPVGWGWESCHSAESWAQVLGDPLDNTSFSGSVTSFEDNGNLGASFLCPCLDFNQLLLQEVKLPQVDLILDLLSQFSLLGEQCH